MSRVAVVWFKEICPNDPLEAATKNECIHVDKSGSLRNFTQNSPSWETNQTKTWLSLWKSSGKGYIPVLPPENKHMTMENHHYYRGYIFKWLFLLISCLDFFLLWSWILLILPSTPFQSNVDTLNICIQKENTTEFHHFGSPFCHYFWKDWSYKPIAIPSPTRNLSALSTVWY